MLAAMIFAAGFAACIVCQWLYAAWSIGDWALRFMRRGRLADLLYWLILAVLVAAGAAAAVYVVGDLLTVWAWSIRAGRY